MSGMEGWISSKIAAAARLLTIALVTAFLLGCFVSSGTAATIPATQTITEYGDFVVNYDNLTVSLDGVSSSAIVGQEIQFFNATGGPSGRVTLKGISENNAGEIKFSLASGRIDLAGIKTGDYDVTGEAVGCNATVISIGETSMDLKLKMGTKTITSIPKGTKITVSFTSSLDPYDGASLEVKDPSGLVRNVNPTDGTVFTTVNIEHISDLEIDTAAWELGTYTFKVKTVERYARGLEKESPEVKLEIVSSELKIEARKTEVVEHENVKLTVTGVPGLGITIAVDRNAQYARFPRSINDNPTEEKIGSFTDSIDTDGKSEYVVNFERLGSYTVRVTGGGAADYVDIAVVKKKVTFTTPQTCSIGSDLVINGTANTGKTVDIAINDRIVKAGVAIDSAGKFEVKLPTPATPGTSVEDAIKIKGFIAVNEGKYALNQTVAGEDYDGSALVLMVVGGLTAESSVSVVAPGDSFTLSGTAPGSKVVDILIIAPKGRGMNPSNSEEYGLPSGMCYETAAVRSGTAAWSIELKVDEDADTGTYLVFLLTPGKNQRYDGLRTEDLLAGLAATYFGGDLSKFGIKTQEQIRAMLTEVTTGAAGSDDQLKVLRMNVRRPEVALYVPAEVVIGENLTIAGTSNREGHTIILKVKGPLDLGPKFVTVLEGEFEATYSTTEALTGEYTVEANDGEGHTDTATVTIIPPVRIREEPLPTPVPSSSPSVSTPLTEPGTPATAESAEHAPTEPPLSVPGFEAVAVLLALLTAFISVAIARPEKR